MRRALALVGLCALLAASSQVAQANTTPDALRSITRAVKKTHQYQRETFFPERPYSWMPHRAGVSRQARLSVAARWWKRATYWHAKRVFLATPPQSACWKMLYRAFAPTGQYAYAHMVVTRESHCTWSAQNPTSTATGVFQFLDEWGPLAARLDAAWNIARAKRAVLEGGWGPWACC